jgi:hypothetical protein
MGLGFGRNDGHTAITERTELKRHLQVGDVWKFHFTAARLSIMMSVGRMGRTTLMGLLWALASSAQSPSGLAHASQEKPSRVAGVGNLRICLRVTTHHTQL